MSAVFEFPWERLAQHGEEMPDGLTLPDQLAFTALRNIYQAYRCKTITRERASAEKAKIRRQYDVAREQLAFRRKLSSHQVALTMRTEAAKNAFRKNPTVENAIKLCNAMDGIKRPDLTEGSDEKEKGEPSQKAGDTG